ncbi:uncharacterized protein LOC112692028 [Sipha flava]|uniref:Uncharacterized protein LOC112692028 n=1 Tax=Sipha flava TaxID=143950 RepID=A0A2S2R1X7_9HEMI|nr:uncharacterized protein LOC112692028 [Sipha flava]
MKANVNPEAGLCTSEPDVAVANDRNCEKMKDSQPNQNPPEVVSSSSSKTLYAAVTENHSMSISMDSAASTGTVDWSATAYGWWNVLVQGIRKQLSSAQYSVVHNGTLYDLNKIKSI